MEVERAAFLEQGVPDEDEVNSTPRHLCLSSKELFVIIEKPHIYRHLHNNQTHMYLHGGLYLYSSWFLCHYIYRISIRQTPSAVTSGEQRYKRKGE